MELAILIEQIKNLEADLEKLLPMSESAQQILDKKFRLEFNYNSNHIEGNTLTYGETEQLIIFGETSGNHTIREYEEMQAGDVALKLIQELATEKERPLTEAFIKNLNEKLLVKPYWKDAITTNGQNTRRQINIGTYKKHPNSVILQNGEMFHYASPEETPIMMGELIEWYRKEEKKKELHPVVLAALLHYRFVRIHPFDDGNGRISRLLMNYVLYYYNLPPIVIKSADKKNYLRALNEADTGNIDVFVNYVAEQLVWSLELSIKAAKGERIEEQNDWEKQLSVLKKGLNSKEEINVSKNQDSLWAIFTYSIFPLIDLIEKTLSQFDTLFLNKGVYIFDGRSTHISVSEAKSALLTIVANDHIRTFSFSYELKGFKKNGLNAFNCFIVFRWDLNDYKYSLSINNSEENSKPYHQYYNKNEIEQICNESGKIVLAEIERNLNQTQ